MKNQKGITLVELLAVLAIVGIVTILVMSVFSTGSNASQRTTTRQHLQQEANYIVEVIRSEYLKAENPIIELQVEGPEGNQKLKMGSMVISEGYTYKIIDPPLPPLPENQSVRKINPNYNSNFEMEISAPNSKIYKIETKFSKLR